VHFVVEPAVVRNGALRKAPDHLFAREVVDELEGQTQEHDRWNHLENEAGEEEDSEHAAVELVHLDLDRLEECIQFLLGGDQTLFSLDLSNDDVPLDESQERSYFEVRDYRSQKAVRELVVYYEISNGTDGSFSSTK
jgi:hypothetical protein